MAKKDNKVLFKFNEDKMKNVKEYYLGLDMGVGSVGWAVTDTNYNVIKKSQKSLWGSRLFEEAETAAGRRTYRSSRRRLNRRNQRIKLLQEYFAPAISKIDPGFYIRLKDSFFYEEDKTEQQKNTLFNDSSFTDKDYHLAYPTIYHLRKELIDNRKYHDPRLVYLACAHILKNRGHFLYGAQKFNTEALLEESIKDFNELYYEYFDIKLFNDEKIYEIESAILEKNHSRSCRAKTLEGLLNDKDKRAKKYCNLLVGNLAKIEDLFPEELEIEESQSKPKFSEGNYDEPDTQDYLLENLNEEQLAIVDAAYKIYSAAILQDLLSNKSGHKFSTISEARIDTYNQHKKDLKLLKEVVKGIEKENPSAKGLYNKIFKENTKKYKNYVAYSGHTSSDDKKEKIGVEEKTSYEDFSKFLKNNLSKYEKQDERIEEIIEQLDLNNFLPKITTTDNGVIPYQLHLDELEKILDNAKKYIEELNEKKADEIKQIFTFRIPYYVGPFDTRSEFSWIKRESFESIRPWNFNEVVDLDLSSERFIKEMTNKCTYLIGEDVLAKNSILYSEYMIRNQLNTLNYVSPVTKDIKRFDHETIEYLYEKLFVENTSVRVTKKAIANTLKNYNSIFADITSDSIGGMDLEIPHKLKALQDFNRICSGKLNNKEIDKIVEKITVFPDDSEMVARFIRKEEFSDKLTEEEIKKLSRLRYTDWAPLSEKFLTGIKTELNNGRKYSIIDILRKNPLNPNSPLNLMQIINLKEFNFSELIEEHNLGETNDPYVVDEELLDSLRLSAPVRRSINQTLLVCEDIFKIMGGTPKKIFVEMTRSEGEKGKRTTSRKKQIEKLYESIKTDLKDWYSTWENKLENIEESKFRSKRLYLYAMQAGRDMYSGEVIDDPLNLEAYDIDHIYPRSKTKDDGWNNLVLVSKKSNAMKGDKVLSEEIQNRNKGYWQMLLDKGFMSEEKYRRLTRKTELDSEELRAFVNRQLVETGQSTKAITTIFNRILPESKLVFVKANLVSDFRYNDGQNSKATADFYFPKVRDLNSYHHAKDAYLNIVVGNVYDTKFTEGFFESLRNREHPKYNLERMYDNNISDKNGELVWIAGENGTIATVKKFMNRNNIFVTHRTFKRTGAFYDEQLVKKGNGYLGKSPIKTSVEALRDVNKYGGYNKVYISHFMLAEYKEKNKYKVGILSVPRMFVNNAKVDEELKKYLEGQGISEVNVLIPEIKVNDIIEIDEVPLRIMSKTNDNLKVAEYYLAHYSLEQETKIKEIERYVSKGSLSEVIDNEVLNNLFKEILRKMENSKLAEFDTIKKLGARFSICHVNFENLDIDNKSKVIMGIITLINGSGGPVDLSMLLTNPGQKKTGEHTGIKTISMNLSKIKRIRILHQSPTGFYSSWEEVNLE